MHYRTLERTSPLPFIRGKFIFYTIIIISSLVGCKVLNQNDIALQASRNLTVDSLLLSLHQEGKFNGNLLVAYRGKIVYQKQLGYLAPDKERALQANDLFNIGSIYKEIPAVAIMQLSEKKQLSLDEPIAQYFPNLPQWVNQVTIQHLLQYTSGLPKIAWGKSPEISDNWLLEELENLTTLKFSPGENYLYTNYSPFLLAKIVEKLTKLSFTSYVQQNIFTPCRLKHATFKKTFPFTNRTDQAIPFNANFKEDKPPFVIQSPMFLLVLSAEDLFKFSQALHQHRLISKASLARISQTAKLPVENMEAALGQVVFTKDQLTKHTHHGSSGNFEVLLASNYSKGTTLILMTNQKNKNLFEIKAAIEALY